MFRLSRTVRFSISDDLSLGHNNYGSNPPLAGAGQYFELAVTVQGGLDARSQYLLNIKDIDAAVRKTVIPQFASFLHERQFGDGSLAVALAFESLASCWPSVTLDGIALALTPFRRVEIHRSEIPMIRCSQKFEFSASHRLHNPVMSDEENDAVFGKCNNPYGHGHNYELQVTLRGKPDSGDSMLAVREMERIVDETIIKKFDHRNLNLELPEFHDVIPTVENIAMVIYRLLKPKFTADEGKLASVTVWETPKTWCEYSE